MTVQSEQAFEPKGVLFDSLLILLPVSALLASLFFLNITFTIAFTLLAGTWVIDVYLKRHLGLENITAFADLSFASFVFASSHAISLMTLGLESASPISLTYATILSFIIGLLWLGNLSICRGLNFSRARSRDIAKFRLIYWLVSAVFAILSTFLALIPQIVEAI